MGLFPRDFSAGETSFSGRMRSTAWRYDLAIVALLALCGAIVSVYFIGFRFGVGNNVFHVPLVLEFQNDPRFADDAFVSSLQSYQSYVYRFLRLICNQQNIKNVFFIAHLFSRICFFYVFLLCLRSLGVRSYQSLLIAAIMFSSSALFFGFSDIGKHDLFIRYFTHNGMAYVLMMLGAIALVNGKEVTAFALVGIIFNVSAFTAVWCAFAFSLVLLSGLVAAKETLWTLLRHTAICFGIAIVVSLPTAYWILRDLLEPASFVSFDYLDFIREYFPKHFLISAARPWDVIIFCSMVTITLIVLHREQFQRVWVWLYRGFLMVFALGVFLPYFTSNRLLINLHLLRSDGVLYLLSILFLLCPLLGQFGNKEFLNKPQLGVVMVLFSLGSGAWYLIAPAYAAWMIRGQVRSYYIIAMCMGILILIELFFEPLGIKDLRPTVLGPITALYVSTSVFIAASGSARSVYIPWCLTLVATVLCLASRKLNILNPEMVAVTGTCIFVTMLLGASYLLQVRSFRVLTRFPPAVLFLLCFTLPAIAYGSLAFVSANFKTTVDQSYSELLRWVRGQHMKGPVLIPLHIQGARNIPDFQIEARLPVWVTRKTGAAVLWEPSFYEQWWSRYHAVKQLKTPEDISVYCVSYRIPYCVLQSETPISLAKAVRIYQNRYFQMFRFQIE